MKLDELKDKKILLLGFGKEGKDTLKFLRRLFPKKKIGVADAKLDRNYRKTIDKYDVVIKSPGVPIHLPEVEKAFKNGKITSQTEIFLQTCPGKVIGVTGTKGKSTTSFWIYQTLKKAGLPVKLVGNIGKPSLTSLLGARHKDIFVYEMSAHHLYGLEKSPNIAVLLNVYREHLDYYRSFNEYASAKGNIAAHQTKGDWLIYNSGDKTCAKIAKKSPAKKIAIEGQYYELNRAATEAAARIFGVEMKVKLKNLPHRLEFVGEFKKIRFYNDSLSTVPETAILALDRLKGEVQTIILGGFDRGQDFGSLAKRIKESKIKSVILFRPAGERIRRELTRQRGFSLKIFWARDMAGAVKLAFEYTKRRKICLLSPAAASFGIFKDYRERGNLFKKYVRLYGKEISSSRL